MKTNNQLSALIQDLKRQSSESDIKLWKRIAVDLEKPTRQRKAINLGKLDILTKENDVVIVPGKVLGTGDLNHKITIAALNFSSQAAEKIKKTKSEMFLIGDFVKNNPKAKNVRILV